MNDLLIGALGALLATNQPAALSNLVEKHTGVAVSIPAAPNPNDPLEMELAKIMAEDNAAQAEVDRWILENEAFVAKGIGLPEGTMRGRIRQRFDPVRKHYENFIQQHPDYTRARIAYASMLSDLGDETGGKDHLERALQLDPKNAAAWNNLANFYGHNGPAEKAFECYEKAIEARPNESVYFHNFGTTVYLFRKDAMAHYKIDEQQVFDKALKLYAKALELDPNNFPLATDVAKTYYGIKPLRLKEAIGAYEYALKLASDDVEREGIYIHFARLNMLGTNYAATEKFLGQVTNQMYAEVKENITKTLHKKQAAATNAPPAVPIPFSAPLKTAPR